MEQVLLQRADQGTASATEKKQSHARKPGLDVLRAIAILLVVWYHSFGMLRPLYALPLIGPVLKKLFVASTWIGPLGVDLFFVLSGYLIGSILIKLFLREEKFSFNTVVNFWMRRWLRTVPNYFFVLAICFALYKYLFDTEFQWKYFLFLQNLATPHPNFFGEAWSLAVEEWFYLTVPVALLAANSFTNGTKKNKVMLYTFSLYLLVFIALRFIKAYIGTDINLDTDIRKVVVFRLDAIMYGVMVALAFQNIRDTLFNWKNKLAIIGVAGLFLTIIPVFLILEKTNLYLENRVLNILINSSYYTLIPIFFSLLLPYAVFIKKLNSKLLHRAITHISLISYSMYLIHYSLIYIPFFEKIEHDSISASILLYIGYWILVFVFSEINYKIIEAPVMKLRNKISPESSN